ncbi:MAG TPA: ComEC/Rec2 family competence protein, partial [Terriglobales bacterium]
FWAFRFSTRTEWAVLLTLLITVGYAWLTDLGAPILRSVLMVTIAQLTAIFYRERNALNAIGVAALALLAWEPRQLFDASFQLTFLAVVVIAGVAVPVIERTSQPRHRALDQLWLTALDPLLPPDVAQFRVDVRLISTKLANILPARIAYKILPTFLRCCFGLWELIVVSVLMQFAMALPTAWYFHRIAVHGIWANMAVIPLTAALMPSSVLAVAFSYIAAWLAKPLAWIAGWSLAGISGTVHILGGTGMRDVRIAMPSNAAVIATFMAMALAILVARRHRWLCAMGIAMLVISAGAVYSTHRALAHPAQKLELTAIDIGQGDSLLLITPQGRTLLLDSGGPAGFVKSSDFDIGEDVVSPYLWERGIDHLDAVAFSHAHSDHVGGMRAVIRNFHPREIWLAPNLPTPVFLELMQSAIDEHVGAIVRHAGDEWEFGGATFRAIAPPLGWELNPKVQDDNSFVLRVSCGNTSALLPGDMHRRLELALVESNTPLAADLLKVPHHGSSTSSSDELLAAVHPRYALISSGRNNSYGHPRADVLSRLAGVHAKTYRTDLLGPVTFYLGSDGVSVQSGN